MGRPKRPTGATEQLHFRLSPLEKSVLVKDAAKAGLSISEYVRRRSLGIRVISRMDDNVINELRRLGGLQKHLASQMKSRASEFDQVMRDLVAAINRIR